jgi:hypothetical protein
MMAASGTKMRADVRAGALLSHCTNGLTEISNTLILKF